MHAGQFFFSFRGRISRRMYWLGLVLPFLLTWLTFLMLLPVDAFVDQELTNPYIAATLILSVAWVWPAIALGAKRCHDRDKSGWFQLVGLIPCVGAFWLLIELGFVRGTLGPNRFGPDPLGNSWSESRIGA